MSLERVAQLIEADEVYRAWRLIEKTQPQSAEESVALAESRVKALASIVSDLDEHGDANMDQYGGGDYSAAEFHDFLLNARNQLLEAQNIEVHPAVLPPSPQSVQAGPAAWKLATGNVRPLDLGNGTFLSTEGEHFCRRNLADGSVAQMLDMPHDGLRSVAVSPDKTLLGIGFWGGRTALFDLQANRKLWESEAQNGWVRGLLFSQDGRQLISAGEDCVAVQAVADGSVLATVGDKDDCNSGLGQIHALFLSADGQRIVHMAAVAAKKNNKKQINLRNAKTLELLSSNPSQYWNVIHETIGDSFIVNAGGKLCLLDQYSGFVLHSQPHHPSETGAEYSNRRAYFNADLGLLAVLHQTEAVRPEPDEDDWNEDYAEEDDTPLEPLPDQVQIWGLDPWKLLATIELKVAFCSSADLANWLNIVDQQLLVVSEEETWCYPLTVKA